MILNFIMGFVFGLTFALILLLIVAWRTAQENKGNNSSTFDWEKGEYNGSIEDPENKKKI
jgi:hypothetical protein